ncbi:MAG: dihydroorotate dehydrogenase electron transfer subunit [Clostridia bacterium]|nr:dihydroorotate dehydrogenase electron transfer subunit [Clostridia bacterium]
MDGARKTVPADVSAELLRNERLAEGFALLTLRAPAVAAAAHPGQFVNISCDRFLRRPFGIAAADPDEGTIQVGIQIKGEGTRDLAGRRPGSVMEVLGPLGRGFSLDGIDTLVVMAGGTGLFPALFLLSHARSAGLRTIAYCGFRSAGTAFLTDRVEAVSDTCRFSSDLGDLGFHGTCVDALCKTSLTDGGTCTVSGCSSPAERMLLAAIGPMPMMDAARRQAEHLGIPCQVSLEERMACGIGVCLVCACKTRPTLPDTRHHHSRCCADGPVFKAEDVVWE